MSPAGTPDLPVSPIRYQWKRAVKHVEWARSQGIRRLVEEDELDPVDRLTAATRRLVWRARHGGPRGAATPVYVVGAQRSGTNMLMRVLARPAAVEVHNENDRAAFHRFLLRPDETVASIVEHSRHRIVLFKPLCDSGRVGRLLDELPTATPGRAVWVYRNVDDRARSAVAKFGDTNRRALRAIAEDGAAAADRWEALGMSERTRALLAEFDYDAMSPETASSLFWYARNVLFFEQGLDRRPDVRLVSYDRLVADPADVMRPLFSWLALAWADTYVADIEQRAPRHRPPLDIDPRVRSLCTELGDRLDAALVSGSRSGAAAAS